MPKEEEKNNNITIDEPKVAEKIVTQENIKNDVKTSRRYRLTILIAAIIVSVLLAGAIVAVVGSAFRNSVESQTSGEIIYGRQSRPQMMQHIFVQSSVQADTSDETITSGVVVSVKDSTFVVAGNGSQVTVNTTGDTTYNVTTKKVSVNDSVTVFGGAISNNTVTATDVRVINQ